MLAGSSRCIQSIKQNKLNSIAYYQMIYCDIVVKLLTDNAFRFRYPLRLSFARPHTSANRKKGHKENRSAYKREPAGFRKEAATHEPHYRLYKRLHLLVVSLIAWLDNLQMYFASLYLSQLMFFILIRSKSILPYFFQVLE